MSLPLIFLLSAASFVALLLKRRRTGLWLAASSLMVTAMLGLSPLPSALLTALQTHHESAYPDWKTRNAIVVLGAGTLPGNGRVELTSNGRIRVQRASELYFSCARIRTRSCQLFLSGGDPLKNGATEAAVMARELEAMGVPKTELILEADSRNTFQNARNTAPLLRGKGFELTVLTTSGTHMRRALLFFSFFLVEAVPAPADRLTAFRSSLPVSFNLTATDVAMHEYLGILQFRLYNLMGWNKRPEA